jgi:hypothetical protein
MEHSARVAWSRANDTVQRYAFASSFGLHFVYKVCPECGYERTARDTVPVSQCPACGLIFAKWMRRRFRRGESSNEPARKGRDSLPCWGAGVISQLKYIELGVSRTVLGFRALTWVGLVVWGCWFLGMDHRVLIGGPPEINRSFMHRVDLVFHEAGHVIFVPLGCFMSVLGGSLAQVLMPLVVAGFFLLKHDNSFGASVAVC